VSISRTEYEALLRARDRGTASKSESTSHHDTNGHDLLHTPTDHISRRVHRRQLELVAADIDSPQEGRILQDPHGNVRYLGESSGATFLNHLREFMATVFNFDHHNSQSTDAKFISALGRYQTHDSRPLLVAAADPLALPTMEQARNMVSELRYWTRDGPYRVVSGGLYYWADLDRLLISYETWLSNPQAIEHTRDLALINAVFAIACQLNPACAPDWDVGNGQTFFARSRGLIDNPLDVASLSDANVLTLLAFYLLNSNRRDASYMYISVALHIYCVHGVHRAWSIDEDGKRKFWDAFNLDRWLSCLMGRPTILSDEAIRLDAPRDTPGMPSAMGLSVHIELSRITNYVAANVYGVSKHIAEPRSTALCVHKALHMLKQWEHDLPALLRYEPNQLKQDEAVYELQMGVNHVKILAVRIWLFDAVRTVTIFSRGNDADILHSEEIEIAIAAARQTIWLVKNLPQLEVQKNMVHAIIHYVFNAALALELYQIVSRTPSAADRNDFSLVIALLSKQQGSNKPFATDCATVLSDLSCMIGKLRERILFGPRTAQTAFMTTQVWNSS
jgi:hypothetical protein